MGTGTGEMKMGKWREDGEKMERFSLQPEGVI
jgi:hypothetical protein